MSQMILATTTPVMLSWIETRMLANRKDNVNYLVHFHGTEQAILVLIWINKLYLPTTTG